ncbi:MarR family winged helix-turn-helix transcriptional regulator [Microbulbifer harenosus]|uniref:MarR family transcriptional regulator n=1 Tax=Microbulbifer harenosus TaxID=2576840 RepID=A0ABY2UIJ2_9GAMM|nr:MULTISPECIES: MarR family transcriptional regulator [Microbulbifer]QIL89060.1 MarR family transcriptional regulator [Microbulbifer sp. SH-1]TLM77794.1 MarR family transcriptional regulator [Microbulbifer harenosus]
MDKPGSNLSDTLHRLAHGYKCCLRAEVSERELGLPITHIRALKGIYRNPESTAFSIARRMQRDKAQITRVLKELLNDGLIEKRPNPTDGRSQLLFPTEKGRAVMQQLLAAEREAAARMTRGLTQKELQLFTELSARMVANLNADPECNSN